jgi:hypothetical protein
MGGFAAALAATKGTGVERIEDGPALDRGIDHPEEIKASAILYAAQRGRALGLGFRDQYERSARAQGDDHVSRAVALALHIFAGPSGGRLLRSCGCSVGGGSSSGLQGRWPAPRKGDDPHGPRSLNIGAAGGKTTGGLDFRDGRKAGTGVNGRVLPVQVSF